MRKIGQFFIEYEKWSPMMGGNGIAGTIRTTPENYHVATIDNDGQIFFTDIETMTSGIDQTKVKSLWEKGMVPTKKQSN